MIATRLLCCCSSAVSTVNNGTGKAKNWISGRTGRINLARLLYSTFLLIGFCMAWLLRDGFFHLLTKSDKLESVCKWTKNNLHTACYGSFLVHRISFVLVAFYSLFWVLASPIFFFVPSKIRLMIQCDGYIWKIPIFLIFCVISYFIPNEFFIGWAWLAAVMSGLFLVVQTILIIDWAYDLQVKFTPYEDEGFTWKQVVLLGLAAIFILGGLLLFILAILFYGSIHYCHLNRFFIIFTVVLGAATTILGIVCRKGILPGAIVFFYAMFICWSALLSDPSQKCTRWIKFGTGGHSFLSIVTTGLLILIAAFSIIRTALITGLSAKKMFSLKNQSKDDSDDEDDGYEEIDPDDEEEVQKASSEDVSELWWSHFVFILSSFFMDMVLTNWALWAKPNQLPNDGFGVTDSSVVAVWIKMLSQWILFLLFAWSCIAPLVLGKWRDFGDGESDEDSL